jgi:hypothetical protein
MRTMKLFTIDYQTGLGSFLDDRGVEWYATADSHKPITIKVKSDTEFAMLMIEFGKHYDEYNA